MKILISMIVGGIIGYFTNWLAIKMLFRPYEAKYFLGYKVPFTPGLIPKEQKRIARSVGHTVEEYLLSPEEVLKHLDEKALDLKIENYLKKILVQLEDYKIRDILLKFNIKDRIEDYSKKLVETLIFNLKTNNKSNEREIISKLKDLIILEGKTELELFLKSEDFNLVLKDILDATGEKVKDENRLVKDYLSIESIETIEKIVEENQRYITFKLRTLLEKEEVRIKLKGLIENLIEENVSGLVTGLIGIENISNKVINGLYEYMRTNKAVGDIKNLIDLGIDGILKLPMDKVYEIGIEVINEDSIKVLLLEVLNQKGKTKLSIGENLVNKLLGKDEFLALIDELRINILERIYSLNIGKLLRKYKVDESSLLKLVNKLYEERIKKNLPILIERMEIGKIVERSILEFEFDFVEELVLDIAEKELKAITKLGGVLGAIIGIITPFLQAI